MPHEPICLVEVCPQCRRPVDTSTSRLITDLCGHSKCRICLLQEVNGCIKCSQNSTTNTATAAPRQSVIVQPSEKPDEGTCEIIKQAHQPDILFPPEIVKRSTGNFYHLKRAFSERFFNDRNRKVDKMCGTDNSNFTILPGHVIEKYYCLIHRHTFEKSLLSNHLSCDNSPAIKETFVCDLCHKVFPNSSKLNRHMRVHLNQSKFQCNTCQKRFRDNNALTTHQLTHTSATIYECNDCGLKFKHRFTFTRHVRKHRGDYAFACDRAGCTKRFLTRVELSRHMVRHTQTKPFACDACDLRYAFRRSLERHRAAVHADGIKKVKCRFCDAEFRRKDNLVRHVKNLHADGIT